MSPVLLFTSNAGHVSTERWHAHQLNAHGSSQYVNEVSNERVRDIDFSSPKKLKENIDSKIDSFCQDTETYNESQPGKTQTVIPSQLASTEEIDKFYEELNLCETKAVLLSLLDPYAEQFVAKSRNVPVLSDLYDVSNLDLDHPELLQKCREVAISMSDEEIKIVDTRDQAKGPGFFGIEQEELEPLQVVLSITAI